jgi:hypothetical protein
MRRIDLLAIAAGTVLAFAAASARAEEAPAPERGADADRLEELERRVVELEQAEAEAEPEAEPAPLPGGAWLPEWTQRVQLGGSASVGYFRRGQLTPEDSDAFQVWDARLFVDAELAEQVEVADTTLVRSIGATFEWDLVRLGELQNDVGELYADFQGIGDSTWLSTQVGRFQIPVGENYLRFSKGYRDNPFISNTVGGPWWWDEGLRFYGHDEKDRFGYVASVSNGETDFNHDTNTDPQGTLKLYTNPWPWLHLSVSGLASGEIGRTNEASSGALWLGETWGMPIGNWTIVPNFVDGVPVPDGPNLIDHTWLVGADAVVKPLDGLRVWLGGGQYHIEAAGGGPYDRNLYYWIAEIVADGRLVSPALAPLYLGLRANGITTNDAGRGYMLDIRLGDTVGFNMRDLTELSTVLGVRIGKYVVLRGEYAFQDVNLVHGVTPEIHSATGDNHWFAFDVGVSF